jgi:SAM-dependent methyltransferase
MSEAPFAKGSVDIRGANVWDERAAAYVDSDAHRGGDDLEQLVSWAICDRSSRAKPDSTSPSRSPAAQSPRQGGAQTALDVATGGGHVARRLREEGLDVVTLDPSPGMKPDVISRAEDLPFADGSFDVVVCRTAAHHFADPAGAVREMARVSSDRVLLVDTEFMGEDVERAEALRDPSHVRNYTEAEWRGFVESAGLRVEAVEHFEHSFDLAAWLARTGCEGDEADRTVALLGERARDGRLTLKKIALKAGKP